MSIDNNPSQEELETTNDQDVVQSEDVVADEEVSNDSSEYLGMSDEEFSKYNSEPKAISNPKGDDNAVEAKGTGTQINYEEEYKKILAPFKANGREIKVESLDDVKALMQMGANYSKKMEALKPNVKMMKMLEDNGFLDEQKLNYLIDLGKQKPEAIARLIKDSKIEPLEIDLDQADRYSPTRRVVNEQRLLLDDVFEEIKDTPAFVRTVDVVTKELDEPSKKQIYNEPRIINIINTHIDNGIYDIVSKQVKREREFGRLEGLSDLQAYKVVGDAIEAKGGFEHILNPAKANNKANTAVQGKSSTIKSGYSTSSNEKVKQMKMSASSTKSVPGKSKEDYNPLALSDEEFLKIANGKYR